MTTRDDIIALLPTLGELFVENYRKYQGDMNYTHDTGYSIGFDIGPKYTRIVMYSSGSRSTNGFVCMVDVTTKQGSFKAGDLLKAAGWKAPALNFARGSIFDLPAAAANIRWTGLG